MSIQHHYNLCCKHKGKVVTIREKCGKRHIGRIVGVDSKYVYLQPNRGLGGLGYGFYGGYGYPGYGARIALGFIAGVAVGGLFFW